mgnify:CR=1 FL=1
MNKEARRSNTDIVRAEFAKDPPTPRYKMPDTTGLKRQTISDVFGYLRRLGELPRPTKEESRRTMTESVSNSRGGIFLLIEPYSKLGMNASEVRDIVYFEQEVVLDLDKVSHSLSRARSRGVIPPMSEESRSAAHGKGKRRPIEVIRPLITTWEKVRPFALRNGTPSEIAPIIDLSVSQVESVMSRHRVIMPVESYFTKEKTLERRRRAGRRSARSRIRQNPSEIEAKSEVMAKLLYGKNLIAEEPVFWDLAVDIAKTKNKNWPDIFAYLLVMEVFLFAKYQEMRGKPEFMQLYNHLGKTVDADWFKSEDMVLDRSIATVEFNKRFSSGSSSK